MVSAAGATPPKAPEAHSLSSPTPRQTAFMHKDTFERLQPQVRQNQPAQKDKNAAGCDLIVGLALCPVRCASTLITLIFCCPCLTSSALCIE